MRSFTFGFSLFLVVFFAALAPACGPGLRLPGVHEPLASAAWSRCAGELAEREAVGMIDDLTLDAKTLVCQGVVLAGQGRVDEGLELLTEAGVRDPEDHRPHYLSGRILTKAGRYEEALAAYQRSAGRFPSMEVPAERLGRQVLEADGPEPARVFLTKVKERNLCPYGCLGLLAQLHHQTGDDKQAEALYSEMIKANPDEPGAYVGLAALRNRAKRYREEAAQLERAVQAKAFGELPARRQADTYYSLSFAYYNAERFSQARQALEKALGKQEEEIADWHLLGGWIELKRDQPRQARTSFQKATSLDSSLAPAHTGLGDAATALEDFDRAISSYKRAHQLDPTDAVVILKLARAHALAGELARAQKLLDEAISLDKEHLPPELLRQVTEHLAEKKTVDSPSTE